MDQRQNPFTSALQKSLDYAAHGSNCSDTRCVLPVCVNFKLATRHSNTPHKDKQNRHAGGDTSYIAVDSWQISKASKEMSLNQAVLDHDVEKQLLEDLEEFEKIFESRIADFGDQVGFKDPFEIGQQRNSLPTYTTQGDCQVRRQASREKKGSHQPNVTDYGPIFNTSRRTIFTSPAVPTVGSIPDSSEDPLLPNYYEQFMRMDQNSDCVHMTAKRTRTHQDMMPADTAIMEKTAASIKGTTEQPQGIPTSFPGSLSPAPPEVEGIQPKPTNKMFGVLAEILRMFEKPMSAEVEAFFVQVLQKALKEIKNAVPHDRFKCADFRAGTSALK